MSGHARERASLSLTGGGVSYILQATTRTPATCGGSSAYDGGRLCHAEVRV